MINHKEHKETEELSSINLNNSRNSTDIQWFVFRSRTEVGTGKGTKSINGLK